MNSNPLIVFCTTCKGRLQHIIETLPRNIADNSNYPNCKFVIVDYSSNDGLEEYLQKAHSQNINSGLLTVYRYKTEGSFHVSHAKNIAARCGIMEGAEILVTLDADNFTGPNFAWFIARKFQEFSNMFLCPNIPYIQSLPHGPTRPARGYAGRLVIRAQDFIKMGGYDEIFCTWRGEDIDLISRLQRIGYNMQYIDNNYLNAIPHNAEVRFKEYPDAQKYENKREVKIIGARKETVVNFGKFGLGAVYLNFSPAPIELKPIPTRIFGIGMHKTGTSSLHKAFQILGYDSFHWGAGESPLIWQEMNSLGRSKTLERWYALSDLPIPLLYQKLDKAYPGSKFILTVRNEDDWLQSVSKLWDARYNPTRWMWNKYPFSNLIHTEMYGQKDFNDAIFLERYYRHNDEVKEYFRNRPEDLLILSIGDDKENEWSRICEFLGTAMPSIPFPVKNQTKEITASNFGISQSTYKNNMEFEVWVGSEKATYSDPKPSLFRKCINYFHKLWCSLRKRIDK